ncbi:TRMT11 [Acrasis kona]|uniref:tRNA (guanine(10)-N(2))-methyltransferase n=1 Tax=Acrasis kona TaxID=1008807 RepID=A0AAW2ZLS7_9EUKA
MEFLFVFHKDYETFRLPELDSVAKLLNVQISYSGTLEEDDIFLVVKCPSEQDATNIANRCILLRGVYEVLSTGDTYENLAKNARVFIDQNPNWAERYLTENTTFKLNVVTFGKKRPNKQELIDNFMHLPWKGKVSLESPQLQFDVLEACTLPRDKDFMNPKTVALYFCRKISDSARDLITKYDLKQRKFIGTTSMNASLSFLVANQGLVTSKSLIMDPFAGTGSLLVSAAHFGAHVIGSDIDIRVLRGKQYNYKKKEIIKSLKTTEEKEQWKEKQEIKDKDFNIKVNLDQYGLTKKAGLDLVRIDLSQTYAWRFANNKIRKGPALDAIICDPPYGIRAGARKIGKEESEIKIIPEEKAKDHIPSRIAYEPEELMADLMEFAARSLVVGGRLVYWFHCGPDFIEDDLPKHPQFKLISNSIDVMTQKQHRRLITVEKFN